MAFTTICPRCWPISCPKFDTPRTLMLRNSFNPLFSKADSEPPTGGGNPTPAPAPEKSGDDAGDEKTEEEPEPEKETEPTPEPAAAKGLTAFERGKLRALGMGALISRVEKAELGHSLATSEISRLTAENARLSSELDTLKSETPKKIEAAARGRENEVSKKVTAELSGLGITPDKAPSQMSETDTPESKLEKLHTLKGAERTAFYRANKADLKAAEKAAEKAATAKN